MEIRKIILVLIAGTFLPLFLFSQKVSAAPLIANYYLGNMPSDSASIDKLSKTQLLIINPDQALAKKDLIDALKKNNPNIIILAYVPSQSYNYRYWPTDLVYRNMQVRDDWWLKDSRGNKISSWPGIYNINLNHAWSEYLTGFVNQYVASIAGIDGIFFDMVNEGISANGGDMDLNGDGARDSAADANYVWIERMKYLLDYASSNLKTKYIVINGSSYRDFQPYINGRMYETFPTPWEFSGAWGPIMARLETNQALNKQPQIYVFNSNTNNTGISNDYRKMRFGLASSLMLDNVYFSFDHGDASHNQVWWYDEYDIKLGAPTAGAVEKNSGGHFHEGVWRRDYANGIALLNTTNQSQSLDLGGEFERIIGKQDPGVNSGSIQDSITLGARDGIILLKTFQSVSNVWYDNGSFLRFYKSDGSRARNGFFAFEDGVAGGAKIFKGDLSGSGATQKIVGTGAKFEIFNESGGRWYNDYPFGGNYAGKLSSAVGNLMGDDGKEIAISGTELGQLTIFDYHGSVLKKDLYPLGKKYRGGFSLAAGRAGGAKDLLILGSAGAGAQVLLYDAGAEKIVKSFYPYEKKFRGSVSVAAGNFDGNGKNEIATVAMVNKKPLVRIFNVSGKKLNEFYLTGFFGAPKLNLGAADVNLEGRDALVVMSD